MSVREEGRFWRSWPDLDPASREEVIRILETWREGESEEELTRLLGKRLSKRFLAKLDSM